MTAKLNSKELSLPRLLVHKSITASNNMILYNKLMSFFCDK